VVTRQDIAIDGCEVVNSLPNALKLAEGVDEVFIVGGAEIYKQAMQLTDRIYLTIVHENFDGDTYFPEIKEDIWKETAREDHQPDEKHAFAYSFITLERR
jgi:dihydrofolate reductase